MSNNLGRSIRTCVAALAMLAPLAPSACSDASSTPPATTSTNDGGSAAPCTACGPDGSVDLDAASPTPADGSPDGSSDAQAPPPPGGFPGQASNPVGYAAAPGYPGSLQPWTGGDIVATSGTAEAPLVYSFYDFVPSSNAGTLITGSHVKFVGCRFQSNSVENYNVQVTGVDVTFEYSSVTPLASIVTAPPHAAWPTAGAGKQLIGDGTGYQIGGNDGYEYGFNLPSGGPVTIDHCDIWGFGNAVTFMGTVTQMIVQSSWIHDAADAAAQKYHTDGPGYLNGGTPPHDVSILGNTIASIGNTNGIAFQAATSPYQTITVSGNYLTGFGYTVDICHETAGSTSLTFENNVLATDIPWVFGPVYADPTTLFHQATNSWKGNKLKVIPGTSHVAGAWTWTAADDGQYLWPDTSTHAGDF